MVAVVVMAMTVCPSSIRVIFNISNQLLYKKKKYNASCENQYTTIRIQGVVTQSAESLMIMRTQDQQNLTATKVNEEIILQISTMKAMEKVKQVVYD